MLAGGVGAFVPPATYTKYTTFHPFGNPLKVRVYNLLYSSMAPPWILTYLGIVEYLVDPAVEVEHGGVGRRRRREAVDVREGEGGQGTL